jgi:DNA-binding FrmR family transcriptional regulator
MIVAGRQGASGCKGRTWHWRDDPEIPGSFLAVTMSPKSDDIYPLDGGWAVFYIWIVPTPLGGGNRFAESHIWKEEADMENENTIRRLKTVEGHLRGVIRMVEEDAYCIDVIRQIQAIEAALNKVSSRILEDHLNSCVITAIQGNDKKERERVLKEITEVFEMSTKV